MSGNITLCTVLGTLKQRPDAMARLVGSSAYPEISGCVYFYQMNCGVLVAAQVTGLPKTQEGDPHKVFGFHIHSGEKCRGNADDPFADALTHYNPQSLPHPYHAGDLPPLFGNHAGAFQAVFTDRFTVCEIIHKTVVIHSGPDDFTSQPAGNAGEKIACGGIEAVCGY